MREQTVEPLAPFGHSAHYRNGLASPEGPALPKSNAGYLLRMGATH
jgi:hypothetical protein